ncbi:MAG: hypothetical protein H7Z43_13925, partial [Clostridia bacterium]|nr:hypothetical protein [Deltaproteobacteria bacterium]
EPCFDEFVKASNPAQVFAGVALENASSLDILKSSVTGLQALDAWVKQNTPKDAATEVPMTHKDKDDAVAAAETIVSSLLTDQANALPGHLSDAIKKELSDKVQSVLDNLKDQFDAQGQDVHLMQIDLQNAMQKSQELMTMITNMSKMVHETMMSIIRNAGG